MISDNHDPLDSWKLPPRFPRSWDPHSRNKGFHLQWSQSVWSAISNHHSWSLLDPNFTTRFSKSTSEKKSALKGLESQKICWSNPCGVFDGERSCWSPCFPLVKSAIFGLNASNPCSCSDPLASQHASCAWVRELPHSQGLRSALVMGLASAENEKIFCATKSASSSSRSLINIHKWW